MLDVERNSPAKEPADMGEQIMRLGAFAALDRSRDDICYVCRRDARDGSVSPRLDEDLQLALDRIRLALLVCFHELDELCRDRCKGIALGSQAREALFVFGILGVDALVD